MTTFTTSLLPVCLLLLLGGVHAGNEPSCGPSTVLCRQNTLPTCQDGQWKCVPSIIPMPQPKDDSFENCDGRIAVDCAPGFTLICNHGQWKCIPTGPTHPNDCSKTPNNVRCMQGTTPVCSNGRWSCAPTIPSRPKDLCKDFYYKVCSSSSECKSGYECDRQSGCVSSTCGCDESTGKAGICTMDCIMNKGLCKPKDSNKPTTPSKCSDFYYKVCSSQSDCRAGYRCKPQTGCVASTCSCDEATGRAGICTRDCRMNAGLCERFTKGFDQPWHSLLNDIFKARDD
eukprot:GILJ01014155.1.p1 GENE.GILJ01014155.1~~GILJ01014155.1.p1  ORF type:complete len:285 (-),score=-2.63 GILJ01014155.1:83-937(-)